MALITRLSGFAIGIALWSVVAFLQVLPPRVLPAPWGVAGRLAEDVGQGLGTHTLATLHSAGLALALGLGIGLALATVLAAVPPLYRLARPYITFLNSVPRIALAPLFILWFGIGIASKVALGVSMIAFVVLITMHAGFVAGDVDLIKSVRAMGGSASAVWRRVLWPQALPHFFSALRVGVSLSILAAVAGEMLLSVRGLGWLIRRRGTSADVEGIFSILVVVGLLAIVANAIVLLWRGRALRWL